ncbi:MAG: VOC family protein [Actinomycetota bacterium]|nr:VOC family protein [Acidimicrobiia bacterium]MDQ3469492.1 VOC family protein [Actinomycetota bacterium]
MTERPRVTLTEIVLDGPDAHELADFYQRLLGGTIGTEEPDWVTLTPGAGGPTLAFASEPAYVPPVWPSRAEDQQMMVHLDFLVDDLEAGVAHAVELGAVAAAFQPQDDVRVMLDPAGHPFCLWVEP